MAYQRAVRSAVPKLVLAALVAAGCTEVVSPERGAHRSPEFSHTAGDSPRLDRAIGLSPVATPTTSVIKGFNPVNPHNGSAVIATIFWQGSENVITAVTDSLTTGAQRTFVGNTYTLVRYVTVNGISMATYVATNVQGFPDAYGLEEPGRSRQDSILAVAASFSTPVAGAGMMLSAWTGVAADLATALGGTASGSGSASSITTIGPGPIEVGANSLVYAAVMAKAVVGRDPPGPPFAVIRDPYTQSDMTISDANAAEKAEAVSAVPASTGPLNPQWSWAFNSTACPSPCPWVATALVLKPVASEPGTGDLTVITQTTGSNVDVNGYTVTVGTTSRTIGANDRTTFLGLPTGSHTVRLSAVASNCTVQGENPRTVTVAEDQPASTTFGVSCTTPPSSGARVTGLGAIGPGTATPGSDKRTFDFEATDLPGGRLRYADYSIVRNGMAVTVTVDRTADPATVINSYSQTSATCVSFGGTARLDNGELHAFTLQACDNGSPGIGSDQFTIHLPNAGNYQRSGPLTEGEITITAGTAPNQPPVANFTSSCTGLTCSFTSTSSDPDGTIASYSWTFGDGTSSTAQNPSKTYSAAGTYTVTLRVTDNDGAQSATASQSVTVTAPNQPPVANFTSSCTGLTCSFTSTSSDPDGTIASYSWTFGDGTSSTAQNPSKTYSAGGTYSVTLRVTDNQGTQSAPTSQSVTVTAPNQPPVANFTSSCTGLTCSFTSTSSDPDGTIASYSWTFGDGTSSTAQNPSKTYSAGGTYSVTLRVTDNQGTQSAPTSQSVTVTAPNQPPVANFTSSCTGLTCSFTSTSTDPDGTIASYSWTFGDGTTSTAQNPSKSYSAAGTYTVTLRVTDDDGVQSATASQSVAVTAPNQPPVANFTSSCTGLACNFTSTSTDPDGTIASYHWTFGDGTSSTAQNPLHVYAAGGTYTVTLRVTDNKGAVSAPTSKTVTVNALPVANFTSSCNGLTCTFASTSSDPDGTIASYNWNFGDGSTSTAQNPSHTYSASGTYTVTLRVTDDRGATSAPVSKTVNVTAPNQAPLVNAGQDQTALTGLLYSLSASFADPDGNGPWSYTIDWGDGSRTTGTKTSQGTITASHTYVTILPRSFTIRVTVTDAAGASGSDTKVVSVLLL